jgi:hypothetical protein
MAARVQSLTKRPARKRSALDALATHYRKVSNLHLRRVWHTIAAPLRRAA